MGKIDFSQQNRYISILGADNKYALILKGKGLSDDQMLSAGLLTSRYKCYPTAGVTFCQQTFLFVWSLMDLTAGTHPTHLSNTIFTSDVKPLRRDHVDKRIPKQVCLKLFDLQYKCQQDTCRRIHPNTHTHTHTLTHQGPVAASIEETQWRWQTQLHTELFCCCTLWSAPHGGNFC